MNTRDKQVDLAMAALRNRALASESQPERERARALLSGILRAARTIAGLRISDAAEPTGVAPSTISLIERGESIPNKVTILALLGAYRPHCEIGVHNGRVWVSPR